MWNLTQTRAHLSDRLAEQSGVFWTPEHRDRAINEAQRFIAAVTRGIPVTVTGSVYAATPHLTVPGKLLGDYVTAGTADGRQALNYVSMADADRVFPAWRSFRGPPRWVVPSALEGRVYITPIPESPVDVSVQLSVLPPDLEGGDDVLFAGVPVMEQYQGALLNIAAALLLLSERYDGDAERFYQVAFAELQALGVDPARIPGLRGVDRARVERQDPA